MRLKTKVKVGGHNLNSNETVVVAPTSGMKLKTLVKAGRSKFITDNDGNHNETVIAEPRVKAGRRRTKKR